MRTLHVLSILALATSSNFDNVGVGIAYGSQRNLYLPLPPILSLPLLAAPELSSQCLRGLRSIVS